MEKRTNAPILNPEAIINKIRTFKWNLVSSTGVSLLLKVGCMLAVDGQLKTNTMASLSHNVRSKLSFFYLFCFTYILWVPVLCFYEIYEHVNEWVFASYTFPWARFLPFACLLQFWCISFALSYYILHYYYSLETCLFYSESQKGMDPDGRDGGEELGGAEGGENVIKIM